MRGPLPDALLASLEDSYRPVVHRSEANRRAVDLSELEEILPRYVGPGPRYTSYPTVPAWQTSFSDAQHAAALRACGQSGEVSLYVHVPFCRSLCHFCACNRVITRDPALPERYLRTIEKELCTTRGHVREDIRCTQLHWGGGTPTHLDPGQLDRLFRSINAHFPLAPGAEMSIEVDPRVTHPEQIAVLAECGFNRISMGVQDTNARTQEAIHRIQPFRETRSLTETARQAGIRRVSFDLIYGLPHQSEASFDRTLDDVLSAQPDRIALYGYAHVTWVAKQQRGFERIHLPGPATRLRILMRAIDRLAEAGYRFIGMDHFARPDDELCKALDAGTLRRNFMGYTTLDGVDVIAFGPSGISEIAGSYVQTEKTLPEWFGAVEEGRLATQRGHELSCDEQARRWIIRRIMCQGRVHAAEVEALFGGCFRQDYADARARLEPLEADGLVDLFPSGDFEVTSIGRLLLRHVAMVFDANLGPDPDGREGRAGVFSQTV